MSLKSSPSHFKAASVYPPGPPNHPSKDGPSQATGLDSVSGSSPSRTQSAPTIPAVSSVVISNEHLNPRVSSFPISLLAAFGLTSASGILENAYVDDPTMVSNTFNSGGAVQHFSIPPAMAPGPASTSGILENARDFVINHATMISNTFDSGGGPIMQLLESKTIRGAEHDSSARYPPPKCHPETRKTLRGEIVHWVANPKRGWRMFYVLGSAGVGKSSVAQSVAEEIDCLGASCFISRPNGQNDPDGVIPTLAYQLAVKNDVYKQIISHKIAHDPNILTKARRVQFRELLVDPFRTIMAQDISALQKPLLIIIDGLDECKDEEAQCEFIELIGDHVRSFPEFPLLWLVCSRPESHLKYALSRADFQVPCRREEIFVDNSEGRQDVLLYLREEFAKIRSKYRDSLDDDWPPENDLLKIATASSGLFAFASTVVRFVNKAKTGDPSSELQVCIRAIESSRTSIGRNPYQILDSLYRSVLSFTNSATRQTTILILGMCIIYPHSGPSKSVQALANFLRITKAAFYHALLPLHSVLRIPPSDAFTRNIEFYHASFPDFLQDPERSGEFYLGKAAVHYDVALKALRWHTDLERDIQKDNIWVSPSENAQTCVKNVKSQSLEVLWIACTRVKGQKAVSVHQELQKFNFNVLGHIIPTEWRFIDFLKWLNQQEAASETQKLLGSLQTCRSCKVTNITRVDLPLTETSAGLFTEGKGHWKTLFDIFKRSNARWGGRLRSMFPEESTGIHFDLGNGDKRRHIHIDQFMGKLWRETILAATFDSSACDPPPRCHPGTRLAIIEQCLSFIATCDGKNKILYVYGPAGVGKSAIMRSVAESPELQVSYNASVFIPTSWHDNGHKAIITTIAYQLAAKCEPYRKLIEGEFTKNPSLFQLSEAKLFNKLIVKPFIDSPPFKPGGRVLVIIDGLDECSGRSPIDLLKLISNLCIKYPSSPLVWLITSHVGLLITCTHSKVNILTVCGVKEVSIDSDEARADVAQFLRQELTVIKEALDIPDSQWLEDRDIRKLADAAGGFFAYAQRVIKYIGDSRVGNPISRFHRVMRAIDGLPIADLSQEEEYPMVLLDTLYGQALFKVPPKLMVTTRKFLLLLGSRDWDLAFRSPRTGANFTSLCNWLGVTVNEAFPTLRYLPSVICFTSHDEANAGLPRAYHQSFIDYIHDPTRSGFSRDIQEEARQLETQCALRILEEAPDGIELGDLNYGFFYGILARGPGTGDKISLTRRAKKGDSWNDNETRLKMYQLAIGSVVTGIRLGDPNFKNELFVCVLITRFQAYNSNIPYHQLRAWAFDEPLRLAIMARGLLKQISVHDIAVTTPDHFPDVKLQFLRPATIVTNLPDPWQSTCKHEREGDWEKGKDESWVTVFDRRHCDVCFERFSRQVENLSSDQTAWVLFTSTGSCCVELRLVDPEDGVSEWAYWFWCEIPLEERRKYGSPV